MGQNPPTRPARTVYAIEVCCRAAQGSNFPGPLGIPVLVWATVAASSLRIAIDRVEARLNQDRYELDDVWECHRHDLDNWDYESFPADSDWRVLAERVLNHDLIDFGPYIYADPAELESSDSEGPDVNS
jgi:hypothetical protein